MVTRYVAAKTTLTRCDVAATKHNTEIIMASAGEHDKTLQSVDKKFDGLHNSLAGLNVNAEEIKSDARSTRRGLARLESLIAEKFNERRELAKRENAMNDDAVLLQNWLLAIFKDTLRKIVLQELEAVPC